MVALQDNTVAVDIVIRMQELVLPLPEGVQRKINDMHKFKSYIIACTIAGRCRWHR
jgi:hypothetical protein